MRSIRSSDVCDFCLLIFCKNVSKHVLTEVVEDSFSS